MKPPLEESFSAFERAVSYGRPTAGAGEAPGMRDGRGQRRANPAKVHEVFTSTSARLADLPSGLSDDGLVYLYL
jgi:hypothetical protein